MVSRQRGQLRICISVLLFYFVLGEAGGVAERLVPGLRHCMAAVGLDVIVVKMWDERCLPINLGPLARKIG